MAYSICTQLETTELIWAPPCTTGKENFNHDWSPKIVKSFFLRNVSAWELSSRSFSWELQCGAVHFPQVVGIKTSASIQNQRICWNKPPSFNASLNALIIKRKNAKTSWSSSAQCKNFNIVTLIINLPQRTILLLMTPCFRHYVPVQSLFLSRDGHTAETVRAKWSSAAAMWRISLWMCFLWLPASLRLQESRCQMGTKPGPHCYFPVSFWFWSA